jgi:hypothetical protein
LKTEGKVATGISWKKLQSAEQLGCIRGEYLTEHMTPPRANTSERWILLKSPCFYKSTSTKTRVNPKSSPWKIDADLGRRCGAQGCRAHQEGDRRTRQRGVARPPLADRDIVRREKKGKGNGGGRTEQVISNG